MRLLSENRLAQCATRSGLHDIDNGDHHLGGERYRVEGDVKQVERTILDAARGSIMQLAWLIEAGSGESLGVNPECVVMLRTVRPE